MLYEKSALGRRYIRVLTGSWGWFSGYVLSGLAVCLVLAHSVQLETIRTYPVLETGPDRLVIPYASEASSKAYLYARRNEGIYPVRIKRMETAENGYVLFLEEGDGNTALSLSGAGGKSLFLDIPQGSETLLRRIFLKGGKSFE
ncbi:hypothetical protein D3C75_615380 [compost metagenome]